MSIPEQSGGGRELFTLDPEQIERTLDEVRGDPRHVLFDLEATYMDFNNPNLSHLLIAGQKSLRELHRSPYTEANTTIHKIVREAGTKDGILPALSDAGRQSVKDRMLVSLEDRVATGSAETMDIVICETYFDELDSEPAIYDVVRSLAEHRVDRDAYLAGAAIVVAGLRTAATEL